MANHENVTFTYRGKKNLDLKSTPTNEPGPPNFKYFRVVANIRVAHADGSSKKFDQSVTVKVPYKNADYVGVGNNLDNLKLYKKDRGTWKIIENVTITGDASGGFGTFVLDGPFDPPSGWGDE